MQAQIDPGRKKKKDKKLEVMAGCFPLCSGDHSSIEKHERKRFIKATSPSPSSATTTTTSSSSSIIRNNHHNNYIIRKKNENNRSSDIITINNNNIKSSNNNMNTISNSNTVNKINSNIINYNHHNSQRQSYRKHQIQAVKDALEVSPSKGVKKEESKYMTESASGREEDASRMPPANEKPERTSKARTFEFAELVAATENFRLDYFLGEGGFGKVYKGHLQDTGQVVAIKQLDRNGCQGIREFVVEVLTLSMADHPNLVKLIGYCAEGDQRLLVYEYMALGSLEDHLHDYEFNGKPLDWNARMKIAAGAARGLEYLHDKMKPPVIYRDLKCSNILLGVGYHPKLSDFGLAKVGPSGDETHVSTRVMGTYGYCAPDYALTGQLTFKSDIYSFGVVLLELITGRRAIDRTKPAAEQNLVAWAQPLFKDRKNFHLMADPALEGQYPIRGLYQALAIAAMCLQEKPSIRPVIADVVTALNYLAAHKYDPELHFVHHSSQRSSSRRGKKDGETRPITSNGYKQLIHEEESPDLLKHSAAAGYQF